MNETMFCDKCEHKIAADGRSTVCVRVSEPSREFNLCGECSGGVLEMLRDMRLLQLQTVR